jgi:hypothetical protein
VVIINWPLLVVVPLKIAPLLKVATPEILRLVNEPAAAVVPPIGVPLIVPPLIVALDEKKLLAVVVPFRETVPVPVLNVPDPD